MADVLLACMYCGGYHVGVCPRVEAIDYYPTGAVRRVTLREPPALQPATCAARSPELVIDGFGLSRRTAEVECHLPSGHGGPHIGGSEGSATGQVTWPIGGRAG